MKTLVKHTSKGVKIGNMSFTKKGAAEVLSETHVILQSIK